MGFPPRKKIKPPTFLHEGGTMSANALAVFIERPQAVGNQIGA